MLKLDFNWAPGTIVAFITAILMPMYTISIPILSKISIYAVNAATITTLALFLVLTIFSAKKANHFYDDTEARSTYNTLKRINLISLVLFIILITGVFTHVILSEELRIYPPHWDFILNYTGLCTYYIVLFPKILPPLTLVIFIVSCFWPLTTVFFKSKS